MEHYYFYVLKGNGKYFGDYGKTNPRAKVAQYKYYKKKNPDHKAEVYDVIGDNTEILWVIEKDLCQHIKEVFIKEFINASHDHNVPVKELYDNKQYQKKYHTEKVSYTTYQKKYYEKKKCAIEK